MSTPPPNASEAPALPPLLPRELSTIPGVCGTGMHQLALMRELEAIVEALRISAVTEAERTTVTVVALREVVGVPFPWALGVSAYEGSADDTPAPRSTWDSVSIAGLGMPVAIEVQGVARAESLRVDLRWGTAVETVVVSVGG